MAKHDSRRRRHGQSQSQTHDQARTQARGKGRGQHGPAVPNGLDSVFGVHAVRALLERGESPKELWVQEGDAGRRLSELVDTARSRGARLRSVPREELDGLSQGASHQGIVAFCPPLAPEGALLVSESGLGQAGELGQLEEIGVTAFLLGESLMSAADPGAALAGQLIMFGCTDHETSRPTNQSCS